MVTSIPSSVRKQCTRIEHATCSFILVNEQGRLLHRTTAHRRNTTKTTLHLAGEVGDEIEEYNDRNVIELLLVMVYVIIWFG